MKREKKTHIRISKSGKTYYYSNAYTERNRLKARAKRFLEGSTDRNTYDTQRTQVYCENGENEAYMRYFEKKVELRKELPNWNNMSREQWRGYFHQIINMLYTDTDYLQYKEETKTQQDTLLDEKWEDRKRKDEEYDGRWDDYHQ